MIKILARYNCRLFIRVASDDILEALLGVPALILSEEYAANFEDTLGLPCGILYILDFNVQTLLPRFLILLHVEIAFSGLEPGPDCPEVH